MLKINLANMKEVLADRIRKARLMRDLSQQNVADELEITVAAYSNIERGVTDLTVSRLYQIAKVFKMNIVDFFDSEIQHNSSANIVSDSPLFYEKPNGKSISDIYHLILKQQSEIEKLQNDLKRMGEKK